MSDEQLMEQTVAVDPGSLNLAKFARTSPTGDLIDIHTGEVTKSEDSGPPIPEGRGGANALAEATMKGMEALLKSSPAPAASTLVEDLQAPYEPAGGSPGADLPLADPAPRGKRIIEKVGRPRRRMALSEADRKGGVRQGDIVEHKEFHCVGEVLEAGRDGMTVYMQGVGEVKVTRDTAKNYRLIGRGL